jgi:O-acetylserine/cysteine efflux transporter
LHPSLAGSRRAALAALALAGLAWGLTVPLSAVGLRWLGPAWLVALRFGLGAIVLGLAGRRRLRAALRPRVLLWGAAGYGAMVLLQVEAIRLTGVSQVALVSGTVPGLVALLAIFHRRRLPAASVALGMAGAVGGIALTSGGAGGTLSGDGLLLLSSLVAAAWVMAQPSLLDGAGTAAVTGVQMAAAALTALPVAVLSEPLPGSPRPGAVLAVAALVLLGTLLPFTLYAWGRTRVSDELAGAFFNLEALVGWVLGVLAFHDPFGPRGMLGVLLVLGGIVLIAAEPGEDPTERQNGSRRRLRSPGGGGRRASARPIRRRALRAAGPPRAPSHRSSQARTPDR